MLDGLDVMEEMEGNDQKEVKSPWKPSDKVTDLPASLTAWKNHSVIAFLVLQIQQLEVCFRRL